MHCNKRDTKTFASGGLIGTHIRSIHMPGGGAVHSIRTGFIHCKDFYIGMDQAIALNAGLMEASSPLTSAAGLGGLNR
jgi:hypothetical protein